MSVDGINGEQSTPRKINFAAVEFKPLALAAANTQWPLALRAPAEGIALVFLRHRQCPGISSDCERSSAARLSG